MTSMTHGEVIVELVNTKLQVQNLKKSMIKLSKQGMYHGRQFTDVVPNGNLSMSEQHAKDMK